MLRIPKSYQFDVVQNKMKAIETKFKGYRFRSRLEARWAVFFDSLGLEFEYEKEGFDLNGDWYLPDFWFPSLDLWIEIKPEPAKLNEKKKNEIYPVLSRELDRCKKLAKHTNKIVLLVGGSPWETEETIVEEFNYIKFDKKYKIALFSPDFIRNFPEDCYSRNGIASKIETDEFFCDLREDNFCLSDKFFGFISRVYDEDPGLFLDLGPPRRGDAFQLIEADRRYFRKKYNREHWKWHYDLAEGQLVFSMIRGNLGLTYSLDDEPAQEKIGNAYQKAQQARFEFSERKQ